MWSRIWECDLIPDLPLHITLILYLRATGRILDFIINNCRTFTTVAVLCLLYVAFVNHKLLLLYGIHSTGYVGWISNLYREDIWNFSIFKARVFILRETLISYFCSKDKKYSGWSRYGCSSVFLVLWFTLTWFVWNMKDLLVLQEFNFYILCKIC